MVAHVRLGRFWDVEVKAGKIMAIFPVNTANESRSILSYSTPLTPGESSIIQTLSFVNLIGSSDILVNVSLPNVEWFLMESPDKSVVVQPNKVQTMQFSFKHVKVITDPWARVSHGSVVSRYAAGCVECWHRTSPLRSRWALWRQQCS